MVWGSIAGLSPAAINYHCNHISGLYVTTGSAADTVNVLATTTPVYLNSRGGQDVVYVGDDHSVQRIAGKLTIDNQRSVTTLNVDDSSDTVGRKVTLTTSGGGTSHGVRLAASLPRTSSTKSAASRPCSTRA